MERRDFLKTGCKLCLLGATGYLFETLASCAPAKSSVYKTEAKDNRLTVPLALFQAAKLQYVRPKGWYFDIAVMQEPDNTFHALLLKCTHMDNQLYNTGTGYACSLHGSQFDKSGFVKKGPAERPLKQYRTQVENDNLIIIL